MTVKIGLIADPHATPAPLAEALALFAREGCALTLCAGDIAGYGTQLEACIELLRGSGCQCIAGNHDEWALRREPLPATARTFLGGLPRRLEWMVEGVRLSLVHAQPPDATDGGVRLLDQDGALIAEQCGVWRERLTGQGRRVVVVGHTHQLFAEWLGDTLVVNPGSSAFNHSCAILTLPRCGVAFYPLGGRVMRRVWNWGIERAGGGE